MENHGLLFWAAVGGAVLLGFGAAALGLSAFADAEQNARLEDLWSIRFTLAQLLASLAIAAAVVAVTVRGRR